MQRYFIWGIGERAYLGGDLCVERKEKVREGLGMQGVINV